MKTPIKMIVTDLDGTLLRTDKTISSYTISTLRRCKQAGIKLAYASAGKACLRYTAVPI